MNPSDLSGFDPRVQQQLAQLSLDSSSTGSQSSQSFYSSDSRQYQPRPGRFVTQIHPRNVSHPRQNQGYRQTLPAVPPGLDAFPPLGTEPTTYRDTQAQQSTHTMPAQLYTRGSAAQEFFSRARGRGNGRGRGRGYRGQHLSGNDNDHRSPPEQAHGYGSSNNFSRPPPNHMQQSNTFGGPRNFVPKEEQQFWRQKLMLQADFLNSLITQSVTNSLSHDELKAKHTFRKKLEKIAQDLLADCMDHPEDLATTEMTLESYGSLSNSFGTAGCDVDLILLLRKANQAYMEIPYQFQIRLEEALLSQGIGAKLLTNTHVPILQVCELPTPDLLTNLRTRHARQAEAQYAREVLEEAEGGQLGFDGLPILTIEEEKQTAIAFQQLDETAADIPLPDDFIIENAKIEITGDCGIQCDINFTKRVAIHNTKLLWTYGQCDQRVRPIILFIKNWAKARDINTPYQGTLSSYGWVLLGLHYLMNIANPPVIPNLQYEARATAWSTDMLEPFEGYDVAFVKDRAIIDQIRASMPRNKESMGGLLQGFFRYYAQNSGFKWTQDVISIRTQGGLLSKQFKGWTALKRSEDRQNVRHRYLLAIEDPFEVEHNIGRTVGHNGVVAIRDEFRRAWEMIENVQRGQPGQDPWIWTNRDKTQYGNGMDLISKAEKRGDLLRKDQEARREKLAEMRKLAELQEEEAKKNSLQSGVEHEEGWPSNGMLIEGEHLDDSVDLIEDTSQLIHNLHHQDEKVTRMRARTNNRQNVRCEEEHDHYQSQTDQEPSLTHDLDTTAMMSQEADCFNPPYANNEEVNQINNEYDTVPTEQYHLHGNDLDHSPSPPSEPRDLFTSPITSTKKVRFVYPEDNQLAQSQSMVKSSQKVGPYIAWSKSSKAGMWLLKRDELIRKGIFKPDTCGEKGRLNATFRYDPDMTQEDLDAKNKILDTLYKDALHPRIPQDQQYATKGIFDMGVSYIDVEKVDMEAQHSLPDSKSNDELLKEWPVTGNIWWSGLTSAGQWLLWRDRKMSGGTWVAKRPGSQYVGDKLSELYPYEGEKTFADVERMNTELDTFFYHIQFPRAGMNPDERAACTAAMEEAIDKVHENRRLMGTLNNLSEEPSFYDQTMSFEKQHVADQNPVRQISFAEVYEQSDDKSSLERGIVTQWTSINDMGRWLQLRDEKISKGVWRKHTNDLFSEIDRIYPFDTTRSLLEQDKLNNEIEMFCSGFVLPGHHDFTRNDKDLAYRAMLKIVEHRKSRDETKRLDVLLDLFKTDKQKEQPKHNYVQPQRLEQNKTINREIQVVESFSQSLNAPPVDTAHFVRQQRLAFYGQQNKPLVVVNIDNDVKSDVDDTYSKDSGAEGSWSPAQSIQNPSSSTLPTDQFANHQQLTGSHSIEIQALSSQHEPVSTDGSEIIPNTLLPHTWKQDFRRRRDQDPRIMPIPRTIDFIFDPRQMNDIEVIKTGGNGCARGGFEYTMETDLRSWGGGGAMAQTSNKWSWGVNDRGETESWQVGDGGNPLLMQDLPDLVDIRI